MQKWRAWAFAFVIVAIAVWIVVGSQTFQGCVSQHRQYYIAQNFKERISNLLRSASVRKDCVGEFIHQNGEAVTAAFTVVLAISTILLWLSTEKLWKAGEKQIEFARQAAERQAKDTEASIKVAEAAAREAKRSADASEKAMIAIDRPWIAIETEIIGPLRFTDEQVQATIKFTAQNIGRSPALCVDFGVVMLCPSIIEANQQARQAVENAQFMHLAGMIGGRVLSPKKSWNVNLIWSSRSTRLLRQRTNSSPTIIRLPRCPRGAAFRLFM